MNLHNMNPWNWFKHEEAHHDAAQIPVNHKSEKLPTSVHHDYTHPMLKLHNDIDRLFDSAFNRVLGAPTNFEKNVSPSFYSSSMNDFFRPSIDVVGDNECYEINLDVPGLKEENLSVELDDRTLLIRGEKHDKSESKDKEFYRVERSYGSFQRTLALPDDALADDIHANLKDGVLTLRIPRHEIAENKEKRRISINN